MSIFNWFLRFTTSDEVTVTSSTEPPLSLETLNLLGIEVETTKFHLMEEIPVDITKAQFDLLYEAVSSAYKTHPESQVKFWVEVSDVGDRYRLVLDSNGCTLEQHMEALHIAYEASDWKYNFS